MLDGRTTACLQQHQLYIPVSVPVLIVPQLKFEEENPENYCENGRGENPSHGGSDRLPVVCDHLLQEHAHLERMVLKRTRSNVLQNLKL